MKKGSITRFRLDPTRAPETDWWAFAAFQHHERDTQLVRRRGPLTRDFLFAMRSTMTSVLSISFMPSGMLRALIE